MKDYSTLTDSELDRLSIEVFKITGFTHSCSVFTLKGNVSYSEDTSWCPTDPYSNQVERFIFPKLNCYILVKLFSGGGCTATAYSQIVGNKHGDMVGFHENDNPNRAKLICALMSNDELNEANKGTEEGKDK